MPKFFFDFCDDKEFVDDLGIVLETIEVARAQAVKTLSDIVRHSPPTADSKAFEVRIRTESGKHLFRAALTFKCEMLA